MVKRSKNNPQKNAQQVQTPSLGQRLFAGKGLLATGFATGVAATMLANAYMLPSERPPRPIAPLSGKIQNIKAYNAIVARQNKANDAIYAFDSHVQKIARHYNWTPRELDAVKEHTYRYPIPFHELIEHSKKVYSPVDALLLLRDQRINEKGIPNKSLKALAFLSTEKTPELASALRKVAVREIQGTGENPVKDFVTFLRTHRDKNVRENFNQYEHNWNKFINYGMKSFLQPSFEGMQTRREKPPARRYALGPQFQRRRGA